MYWIEDEMLKQRWGIRMNILVSIHEKESSLVLEWVKAYFLQEFPDKKLEWRGSGTMLSISLPIGEKEITRIFEELVKRYPKLNVEASCSYEVREDDRSAQWWGTTKIYSQRENGEIRIVSSSSTYWN